MLEAWYKIKVDKDSEETVSQFYVNNDINSDIATLGYTFTNCPGIVIAINKEDEDFKISEVSARVQQEGRQLLENSGKTNEPSIHKVSVVSRSICTYLSPKTRTESSTSGSPHQRINQSPYWLPSAVELSKKAIVSTYSFSFLSNKTVSENPVLQKSYEAFTGAVVLLTLPIDLLVAIIALSIAAVHDIFTFALGNHESPGHAAPHNSMP